MKYTIEGFNQEKAIEYGLDLTDLLILRWIVDFSPKMSKEIIDGKEFFWIRYQALLDDMPILGFTSKDRLYRKLKEMSNKGILEHKSIRNKEGSFAYYTFGEIYQELIVKNNVPYVENTYAHTLKTTEQNNPSTKNNIYICPSEDEQDNPPLKETELADNFDKIWKLYPRKDGKNTAYRHYKAWLEGKMYAGRKVKLNNKQMWYATKKYADLVEKEKIDKQYIKMGSTFFNEAIMEFVEEEK